MKKVLSFSLWGNNLMYCAGAILNALIAKQIYPNYECWYYIHQESVPEEIIQRLSELDNTKIIIKNGDINKCKPMMWRFEAIDDPEVEIMLSRDTDTRILLREKMAVDEWLKTDKKFHIMRDHPHHCAVIQAGMFGTKKLEAIPCWTELINNYSPKQNYKCSDQDFLQDIIYPIIVNSSVKHCSFNKYEMDAIDFPINYTEDYNFVGEYVHHDNSRPQQHINILKKGIEDKNNLKINIITSFYIINGDDEKIKQRNNELEEALRKNVLNNDISIIHLFVDSLDPMIRIKIDQININNKIRPIYIPHQPLYADFFNYTMDYLQDEICMICNSDIYLYECDKSVLSKLYNNVYALSRHEKNLKCVVYGFGAYDAFIFYPKYINRNILKNLLHVQNVGGSDDSVINNLVDSGLKVYNPCFDIKIVHLHESNVRTYDYNYKVACGKYFIKQDYYNKLNYSDLYTYFIGQDYIINTIDYKPNMSYYELMEYCNMFDEIDGFNTFGHIKSNIDLDKLIVIPNSENKRDIHNGIFIKNKMLKDKYILN